MSAENPVASGFPPRIGGFAAETVGCLSTAIDRSWPRNGSNVWELVDSDGRRVFLKQHQTARFHEREVTAYRLWVSRLGPGRSPVLLAADASLLAIVVTALPGRIARDLRVTAATESEIHRQAGTLLRRLHEAAPPSATNAGSVRVAARAEGHIQRAAGLLEPGQARLIREHAARLVEITRLLPAVPTHGDAQTKNFLWDAASHRLGLIDFERAELGPAVRDLVRLEYGPWDYKPHLRTAFLAGYGRSLTDAEEAALRSYAALDAVSALQWGTTNNDKEIVRRAHRTLARLSGRDSP